MAFEITTLSVHARTVIATADTLEAATAAIPSGVCFMEEDADHPGHFDVFAKNGQVYAIEAAA